MAGLKCEARLRTDVPAIHVFSCCTKEDVDARDEPGHDGARKTKRKKMDASNFKPIPETSFRYDGWRIVMVCFMLATFGWGFGFYGQSVYVAELQRLHGWPASLISSGTTF